MTTFTLPVTTVVDDGARWQAYVVDLAPDVRRHASELWEQITTAVGPRCPLPIASCHEDRIWLAWNTERRYLELESTYVAFDWFYRDRATDTLDGTDHCPVAELPPAFFDRLREFVAEAPR